MSKQTSYICDVSGNFITKETAVPVAVKVVRANTSRDPQKTDTSLEEYKHPSKAEHVSQHVLDKYDFQEDDFTQLEVILLGGDVVGWRDRRHYDNTEVKTPNEKQRSLLGSLLG